MAPISISSCPRISKNGTGEIKICNNLEWGQDQTWQLEFCFDNDQLPLSNELDPWLVLALLPAMQAGLDLELDRPVSARLLQNLPTIQNILHSWTPAYKKIKVTAPSRKDPAYSGEGKTACFFSGGIDSFYTILKYRDEIDVLIHLDNPWAGDEGRARMNGKIKEAAEHLGKPLIIVKSNFRGFLDTYTEWEYSHGAAIMTLALFLTPYLSKIYLAGDYTYASLEPNGVHPLLDPLWGTETLEVIHDGLEATRLQKIELMGGLDGNDVMLSSLRVCWENLENELNCGRCRKCLYTMVSLRTAGVLDRCPTFAVPLDLEYLANFDFVTMAARWCLLENLEALETRGTDPELEAVLRRCLANQKPLPQQKLLNGTDPELLELRDRVVFYDQTLRFQIAEKINKLLSKNRAVRWVSETLAHRAWKMLK